jgi:hypothetical protein
LDDPVGLWISPVVSTSTNAKLVTEFEDRLGPADPNRESDRKLQAFQ